MSSEDVGSGSDEVVAAVAVLRPVSHQVVAPMGSFDGVGPDLAPILERLGVLRRYLPAGVDLAELLPAVVADVEQLVGEVQVRREEQERRLRSVASARARAGVVGGGRTEPGS